MHAPLKVLLVEDNEEFARFLEYELTTAGKGRFEVWRESSLKGAFGFLSERQPDVLLLDLSLPDSDGLKTFSAFSNQDGNLPIIVLSGVRDDGAASEAMRMGAEDYLVKGRIDIAVLARSIHYAVQRKQLLAKLVLAKSEQDEAPGAGVAELQRENLQLREELAHRDKFETETVRTNRKLVSKIGELRSAQESVIERERMSALGRMAGGIAHDFNNALAPVVGFSELLLVHPGMLADLKRARGYIEIIHTAAKESAGVVSRLREFYRPRQRNEQPATVSINDILLRMIALNQRRWKDDALAAGVEIEVQTNLGRVPEVLGNEGELRDAFSSLLINATEAIPKKGVIFISSSVIDERVLVTFRDDGIGMSEEVKSRCLEPFFTTKEREKGGLGLGSVYGTVQRHKGEMEIESERGKGTAITIRLPTNAKSPTSKTTPPVKNANASLRILVVEDEPLVREVLSVYLTEDKHEIVLANDGRAGLELYRTDSNFDLVMTDRAMPQMNGDVLAREIKEIAPNQKVILLTGFGDLMITSGEKPEGVDLIIGKPFTLATLRNAISELLGK